MTNRDRAERWLDKNSREFKLAGPQERQDDIDSLTALLDEVRDAALEEAAAAAELKSSPYSAFFRDKQGVGK